MILYTYITLKKLYQYEKFVKKDTTNEKNIIHERELVCTTTSGFTDFFIKDQGERG